MSHDEVVLDNPLKAEILLDFTRIIELERDANKDVFDKFMALLANLNQRMDMTARVVSQQQKQIELLQQQIDMITGDINEKNSKTH